MFSLYVYKSEMVFVEGRGESIHGRALKSQRGQRFPRVPRIVGRVNISTAFWETALLTIFVKVAFVGSF